MQPNWIDPQDITVGDIETFRPVLTDLQAMAGDAVLIGIALSSHHTRVSKDVRAFTRHLGHSSAYSEALALASALHDIGKIHPAYDPEIWDLPERPTPEQRAERYLHTRRGAEMIAEFAKASTPMVDLAIQTTLYHHERLNGYGPAQLTALPEWLQIITIADTYDGDRTMRAHQPERRSPEGTLIRMTGVDAEKYKGAFDAHLLKAFAEMKGVTL